MKKLFKNKRGSIFLGVALGVFIFIVGILILPYLADDVSTFRVALDCATSSISSGTKITCLYGGAMIPYYIWLVTSMALGLIIGGAKS